MPINYSIAARRKPGDKNMPPKYYAKMQARGTVSFDALAEDIAYATTLTDGDVLNVLRALIKQIKYIRDELHITRIEAIRNELKSGNRKTDVRQQASEILLRVREELAEIRANI